MKASTRYSLAGVGGLAVLSLVQWERGLPHGESPVYRYLLGVMPNLAAAEAIPFVIPGIWADQNPAAGYSATKQWFARSVGVAAAGLILWEFMQQKSPNFVFDIHDLSATVIRLSVAVLLFQWVTPRPRNSEVIK